MNNPDTLLVSFDNSHGTDVAVLIVGRKTPGDQVKIVNAFQGGEGYGALSETCWRGEQKCLRKDWAKSTSLNLAV